MLHKAFTVLFDNYLVEVNHFSHKIKEGLYGLYTWGFIYTRIFFQFAVNEIGWNEMDVYVIVLFWILKGKLKKPKKRHRAYRNTMYLPSRDFCLDSGNILSGYIV